MATEGADDRTRCFRAATCTKGSKVVVRSRCVVWRARRTRTLAGPLEAARVTDHVLRPVPGAATASFGAGPRHYLLDILDLFGGERSDAPEVSAHPKIMNVT